MVKSAYRVTESTTAADAWIHTRAKNIAVFLHRYKFPRLVIVRSFFLNYTGLPSTWKPVYWNWLTLLLFVLFTCSCYSDWNATVTLHLEVPRLSDLSRVSRCKDTRYKSVGTLTQITRKGLYISSLIQRRSFLSVDGLYRQCVKESFFWQDLFTAVLNTLNGIEGAIWVLSSSVIAMWLWNINVYCANYESY